MSTWSFVLSPGGAITTLVDARSIVRTRRLHTELSPNVNKLQFRCKHDATVLAGLLSNPIIGISVTKDGADYFNGYLSPNYKTVIRDGQKSLELLAEDPTLQKLGKTIGEPIGWPGYTVCDPSSTSTSLVHAIAAEAGVTIAAGAPTISAVVPYVSVLPGDKLTWAKLLEQILFEYNAVYYFDNSGHLVLTSLVNTGIVTTSATLTTAAGSANIRGELVIEKAPEKYDDIRVNYDLVELKTGIVLFQDTTGGNDVSPANITLEAAGNAEGKDYYPLSAKTGEVYSAWNNPDGYTIWMATSAALDATYESGIVVHQALVNYYRKCSFAYKNTTATQKKFTKLRITGNAYVIASKNTARTSEVSGLSLLEYTAGYIFDSGYAQMLARAISQYYKYSDIKCKVRSTTALSIGQYVTVSDAIYSGISTKCRVVEIVDEEAAAGGVIGYGLEGVADYTAASLVTEAESVPLDSNPTWIVEYIFGRFASTPETPTATNPVDDISWFDTPPAGTLPIWMSFAHKDSFRDLIGTWSAPQKLSGDQGPIGPSGGSVVWAGSFAEFPSNPIDSMAFYHTVLRESYVFSPGTLTTLFSDSTLFGDATLFAGGSWYLMAESSPYIIAQYSSDAVNWHYDPVDGDLYLRMSSDGGTTWGAAVLVKGEQGEQGPPGETGAPGDDAGRYLGALAADPTTGMVANDFYFLTSGSPKKIRKYNGTTWNNVTSSDPQYSQYVSAALPDMTAIALADGDDGFVFFSNLVANNLFARAIQVLTGGAIYSGYSSDGSTPPVSGAGFWLGANGELKALNGEFYGSLGSPDKKVLLQLAQFDGSTITPGLVFSSASLGTPSNGQVGLIYDRDFIEQRSYNTSTGYWDDTGNYMRTPNNTIVLDAASKASSGAYSGQFLIQPRAHNPSVGRYVTSLRTTGGYQRWLGDRLPTNDWFDKGYIRALNDNNYTSDGVGDAWFDSYRGAHVSVSVDSKAPIHCWYDDEYTLTTSWQTVWTFTYQNARALEFVIRFSDDPAVRLILTTVAVFTGTPVSGSTYSVERDTLSRMGALVAFANVSGLWRLQVKRLGSIPTEAYVTIRGISDKE